MFFTHTGLLDSNRNLGHSDTHQSPCIWLKKQFFRNQSFECGCAWVWSVGVSLPWPSHVWKCLVFWFQNSSRRHLECPYPKSLQTTGPISSSKTRRGTSRRMRLILWLPSSHLEIKDKTKNSQAVTHLSAPPRKHQMSQRPQTPQNRLLGPGGGWVGQDFLWHYCCNNRSITRLFSESLRSCENWKGSPGICPWPHAGTACPGPCGMWHSLKAFSWPLSELLGAPPRIPMCSPWCPKHSRAALLMVP